MRLLLLGDHIVEVENQRLGTIEAGDGSTFRFRIRICEADSGVLWMVVLRILR